MRNDFRNGQGISTVEQAWTAAAGAGAQIRVTLQPGMLSQQVTVTAARTSRRRRNAGKRHSAFLRRSTGDAGADAGRYAAAGAGIQFVPADEQPHGESDDAGSFTARTGSKRREPRAGAGGRNSAERSFRFVGVLGSRAGGRCGSSVEVAQEGASSLYGSEALGGVVQFLTRPAEPGGVNARSFVRKPEHAGDVAGGERRIGKWEAVGLRRSVPHRRLRAGAAARIREAWTPARFRSTAPVT